jgi:hypothetical protein
MITTLDAAISGLNTYLGGMFAMEIGLVSGARSRAADGVAWQLEPGHYLDVAGGLIAATPELAARAITWSRG